MKNTLKIAGMILAGIGAIVAGGVTIKNNLPKKAKAEEVDTVPEDGEYYDEEETAE